MPTFVWEGRSRTGELKKGTSEAENSTALTTALKRQNITPTKVKRSLKDISFDISFGGSVKTKEIGIFARQFATMIDAGLPLVQCLEILSKQSSNKMLAKILVDVRERVEGGATFSDALRNHPKVFDDLFVNLIAAGEAGGILDTILNRLAIYLEKATKLKAQVKGAMVYPIAISIVAAIVMVVLLWKVIPVFEGMFKDMGSGQLPGLTQFLIDVSDGFVSNMHWYILTFVGVITAFSLSQRTRRGKRTLHAILLRMPIVGPVLRKVIVARFTRTFGTLLSSGVPILDAMDICARTVGNILVEEAILKARERVAEGKDLAGPLSATKAFPPMVVQMIGVGEQTGALDQMLQKIADFYEEETDAAIAALTSLMEPMMMVVLGGMVGVIIVGMYLPIFEMAGSVRAD
jgi:type IV pilus assembly protein PilC